MITNPIKMKPGKALQRGASIIEYAILAGVISIGLILVLAMLRDNLDTGYSDIAESIKGINEEE